MTSVFVSYSRTDKESVKILALDLAELDYQVWYDRELSGGQAWWDQVLAKIRECDIFAFGLSESALASQACKLERAYARSLAKSIVPILVADDVNVDLLPGDLAHLQHEDYRQADKRALISLLKAFRRLPPVPPLPVPLPEAPAAPVSYLSSLKERVEEAQLNEDQQAALLLTFKRTLKDPREKQGKAGLLSLMRQMRARHDLFAWLAEEIDELIASPLARVPDESPTVGKGSANEGTDATSLLPIKVDGLGEQKSAVVKSILARPGTVVRNQQPLVELDSDKACIEIPSPDSGIVRRVLVKEGDHVAAGDVLLLMEQVDLTRLIVEQRRAAEQGNAAAQQMLGSMYYEGLGVEKDHEESAKWTRRAAESGNGEAQYYLGIMYSFGRGVAKDKAEAVKWLRRAAEQGHVGAQFNLAVRLASGDGTQKDDKEAVRWLQKASQQGHAKALAELQKRGVKPAAPSTRGGR